MTEEIKRILKNTRRTIQFSPSRRYVELFNKEEIQILLDYITNLQQDLDKANDIIEKDRQFYKCRMDEYAEYKSRFEKANTYINEEIKKIQEHQYSTGVRRLNKIQNILDGSDEK